jgi:hypothetical protein
MIKKLKQKATTDVVNQDIFDLCYEIHKSKNVCINKVYDEAANYKLNKYYQFVSDCLLKIGFNKVSVTRDGDTNNRIDSIIIDEYRSIPIEIKSPTEVTYINVKSIGQALENKIILLSRKFYKTDLITTTLVIGYDQPNDRSEVNNLIDYFYNSYNIRIGYIDTKTLLEIRWDVQVEMKPFDLEKIYNLKGVLNA